MSLNVVVLLPILVGFGLIYWSSLMSEEYEVLGFMFRLLFLPLSLLSIQLGVIDASIYYSSNSELVQTLADFAYYLGWVIYGTGAFILYVVVMRVKDIILNKRRERMEEKYG